MVLFLGAESHPTDRKFFNEIGNKGRETLLTLGAGSYIGNAELNFFIEDPSIANVLIGRFCSFADRICFFVGGNHNYKRVTSFPFDVDSVIKKIFGVDNPLPYNRPNHYQVVIGHDVWIGRGVMIMGGVKIGNGAIIGANAVVAKNIPPYAIAVGNPARVIKYRFDEATIKKLLAVKWWNWDAKKIADNFLLMNNVEKFLKLHYSPDLEDFPEDETSRQIDSSGGHSIYQFITDFRAQNPLWSRIVQGFCQSRFENSLLVIWFDKDTTEENFNSLADWIGQVGNGAEENIVGFKMNDGKIFSPAALRKATHFITTREMSTLEALDYLWNTDVKIISALDDGIFIRD